MIDLEKLLEAASRASEGPWHIGHVDENCQFGGADIDANDGCNIGYVNFPRDQIFMCAANPQTIKSLVLALREARDALKNIEAASNSFWAHDALKRIAELLGEN